MSDTIPRRNSLVLYKGRPARVLQVGKKLEIQPEGDDPLSVRLKDVTLLHPGPLESLAQLQPRSGEVATAWELLAGTTTTLSELAELAFGAYTPATAWAAWQLVEEGLYFEGTPGQVVARTPEEVATERAARQVKAAEEQAWSAFLERVRTGQIGPQDGDYLRDVEDLAYGRTTRSRVLRELGRTESPENAHALLLELGYWDHTVNPYPVRLGLPSDAPQVDLPPLPDEERRDLTHLPAFAIDDEGNQEPDDALSLEGDRLWVHIADVAALVPPGCPADLEARARGASLFLPEGTVPMLPWQVVDRLGLGLAEISPALSFGLDLGADGKIATVEVVPAWVRVTRLTYEQADEELGREPLRSLYELARHHQVRRRANGALDLDLPEIKIQVEDGQVAIRPISPLRTRDLVTEAMLMAGQAIGRFGREHGLALPFTTQEAPAIEEQPSPGDLAAMFAVRRALRPSEYTTIPGRHAGLGLDLYTQATSPLRRYLDLVVHQQLRAHLRGEDPLDGQAILARVGATSAVSGSVRYAERLARQHWTLVYLMQHPGWRGEGVLVDRRNSRNLVLIPELDLDAWLHLRRELPLNSTVRVAFQGLNLAQLVAHFRIVK